MPKKLKLKGLKVQSFVTTMNNGHKTKVKGGADPTNQGDTWPCNTCDDTCETCAASCYGTCDSCVTCLNTCPATCDCGSPETCWSCGGYTCGHKTCGAECP